MFRMILLACLLVASTASAYTQDRDRHGGGATWTLCSAETTSDAVCDDGTDDRAATVLGYTKLTFDIYAGNVSVVTGNATDLDAAGFDSAQINSVSLSATTKMIQFDGVFAAVWIKCGTITGGNVTVKVQGGN